MRKQKRALYALVIAALAAGGVAVGTTAAQAHTGTMSYSSACNDDGSRTIIYTGTTDQVPDDSSGNPLVADLRIGDIVPAGSTATPSTTAPVGDTTFSVTQTVPGSVLSASVTAYLTWPDKAVADPIGEAQFTTGCVQPPANTADFSVSTTPGTCTEPGTLVYGKADNVTTSGTDNGTKGATSAGATPVTYSVIATPTSGHVFTDGSATKPAFEGTIPGVDLSKCGTQPADKVEKTSTGPLTPTCATPTVNWTDTTTTTSYTLVNGAWVPGTPVKTDTPQSATLSGPQLDACAGPQPASRVAKTTTGPRTPTCANPTVKWTNTTTTTNYTLVNHAWVAGTPVVTTSNKSATLTDKQKTSCDTKPGGVKGVGGTATPTPSVKGAGGSSNSGSGSSGAGDAGTSVNSSSDTLAFTGTDTAELGALGTAGMLFLLTGSAFVITTWKRRKTAANV